MTGQSQRKRGNSFRDDYFEGLSATPNCSPLLVKPFQTAFQRSPSLLQFPEQFLIPAISEAYQDRLTVVFDLDETLIFARDGPLYVRPGTKELMKFLSDNCETIVWTSSVHSYADAVLAEIDGVGAVQHVVYRHCRWSGAGSSKAKDLRLLGRNLAKTIIVENTPDCLLGNEQNGVLVDDYEGGELEDNTLFTVLSMLKDLVKRHREEDISVPDYINTSRFVQRRVVPTDKGAPLSCNCVITKEEHEAEEVRRLSPVTPKMPRRSPLPGVGVWGQSIRKHCAAAAA